MPFLGMDGPHRLTQEAVQRVVAAVSPGAYALGHVNAEGTFLVECVGRSDDDLRARLLERAKEHEGGQVRYFKHTTVETAWAAFEVECRTYHDFKPLQNRTHPDPPARSLLRYPYCDALDAAR